MYSDPAVLSALGAAVVASACWALALEKAGLGFAYPFMALSFVIVPVSASYIFGEKLNLVQVLGLSLIVVGVAVSVIAYRS
jgi:drug/metabolite transporter (DMT)-like permease